MAKGKIAITLVIMLACAAAWADVVPAARVGPFGPAAPLAVAVGGVEPAAAPAATPAASVPGDSRLCDINWLLQAAEEARGTRALSPIGGQWPVHAAPTADLADAPSPTVTDLPPAPSSLALVLSALASFGAYQGVRSLKRLHLGALPDWYHADAVQIGHATPLQLEFDCSALPVCAFASPSDLRPHISYRIPREHRSPYSSAVFLPVTAPRGPPAH